MKSLFEHLKELKEGWGNSWGGYFSEPTVASPWGTHKASEIGLSYSEDYMAIGRKLVPADKADSLSGKDADSNGSSGSWAVNPRMKDKELKEYEKESPEAYSENKKQIRAGWNAIQSPSAREQGILVVGRAGWGKSEMLTNEARSRGYDVIVVNLAMCAKEDVLGIPVPDRLKSGDIEIQYAPPGWLSYVGQHPKDKICIFFDEFNQAGMDVLGTIQNFILTKTVNGVTYNNIKFIAAGNEQSENRSLVDIDKLPAFKQRFRPVQWISDWDYYFQWHRKEFEAKFGKDLMDQFDANKESFMSPRNLTIHVFGWLEETIKTLKDPRYTKDLPLYTADFVLKEFYKYSIATWKPDANNGAGGWANITPSQSKNLEALADYVSKYIYDSVTGAQNTGQGGASAPFGRSKSREMMENGDLDFLRGAMTTGFGLGTDGVTYGICEENVYDIWDETVYPREVVERAVMKLTQEEGLQWKYKTKKECKKATRCPVDLADPDDK